MLPSAAASYDMIMVPAVSLPAFMYSSCSLPSGPAGQSGSSECAERDV